MRQVVEAITEKTNLAIGLAAGIISGAVVGTAGVTGLYFSLKAEITDSDTKVLHEITMLREELSQIQEDEYGLSQHAEYAARMQLLNPSIRIPDPRNSNQPFRLGEYIEGTKE